MRISGIIQTALVAVAAAGSAGAHAQDSEPSLDQRLRILERKLELADETAAKGKEDAATVSAGEKGFSIRSANGDFELKFRGLLQTDGRFFIDDDKAFNDTFLLRRVEPTFELTLSKLAFFRLQPQFAGDSASASDVYGELRFAPAFNVRAGKFKTPVGLENLQSSSAITFIERGFPTELGSNRDLGMQLGGEVLGGTVSYALGLFNGAPDGRDGATSDSDARKEGAARLFFEPFSNGYGFFRGLGFGVATTHGDKFSVAGNTNLTTNATGFNAALPRYRSPGQNTIFTYRLETTTPTSGVANTVIANGEHSRLTPQLFFYRNSFGLLGEYVTSKQDVARNGVGQTFEHTAYQGVVSYVLTGEDVGYRGVAKPKTPFAADGGWGAFEVAARYGALNIDDDAFTGGAASFADPAKSVLGASTTGVAFNWYLNANTKLGLNYDQTQFDGGAAGADRADEKAVFTRLQISY